jgi:hypothetical protein
VVVAPNDLLGAFLLDACAAHPTTGADSTPD